MLRTELFICVYLFTHVFCFCGTHHVVGCYDCVLLRIFNLVFKALVYSLLFSDAFANGELLYFIFGRTPPMVTAPKKINMLMGCFTSILRGLLKIFK
jgi:hypothetical protein